MTRPVIMLLVLLAATASGSFAQMESDADLLRILGCRGCHVIGPGGGAMGPSLNGITRRMNPARQRRWIAEPQKVNPQSEMPAYDHLSEDEIDALLRILRQQP